MEINNRAFEPPLASRHWSEERREYFRKRAQHILKARHYRDLFIELERNLTPPEDREMIFATILDLFDIEDLKIHAANRRRPSRLGKMLAAMEEEE